MAKKTRRPAPTPAAEGEFVRLSQSTPCPMTECQIEQVDWSGHALFQCQRCAFNTFDKTEAIARAGAEGLILNGADPLEEKADA